MNRRLLWGALLLSLLGPVPVRAADPAGCPGDCNGDRQVRANELLAAIQVALAQRPADSCADTDADTNGLVGVGELVRTVRSSLHDCPQCAEYNPLRNVYWGDLHVHTSYSFDVHAFGVRTTPEQAYRFGQGDPVFLPPLDEQGNGTRRFQLELPLDFVAITDHSEFLGEVESCLTPGSYGYDGQECARYRAEGNDAITSFGTRLVSTQPSHSADICGQDGSQCISPANEVWQRIQAAARGANDDSPACSFTSFVAYEYSGNPSLSTMHRNVIFRNDRVPFPASYFEQPTAMGLWRELENACLEGGIGCDVLAIPHNSNESSGNMFYIEYPEDATPEEQRELARFRNKMEPLVEVYQHKGDSECLNGVSGVIGQPDEMCGFEKRRKTPVPPEDPRHPGNDEDCGRRRGQWGLLDLGCISRLDYVRGVLLAGLQEEEIVGANPYRLGFISSTDTHNGTPGKVSESDFQGHRGTDDDTPEDLLGRGNLQSGGIIFSPGGLAAVWAEEKSRASIFDALRRRETFGTSGPRITLRVFGGWDYPAGLCEDPQLVEKANARGVPMGGVLAPPPSASGVAPTFVISAFADPGTPLRPAVPLQRLQVVKGWVEPDDSDPEGFGKHIQVYDVAGTPDNGAGVDLQTCTPYGTGAASLCTVWTDPDFDPSRKAFYYVRVLENPTCRWSTHVCNGLPPEKKQPACTDPNVPKTIQERAWASPIWYEPNL